MADWDTLNDNPHSILYPPDSQKLVARTGLEGTRTVTAPYGRSVSIIELRGWLAIGERCNAVDPDWHYDLEVDPRMKYRASPRPYINN
jgi:hypothetical protein